MKIWKRNKLFLRMMQRRVTAFSGIISYIKNRCFLGHKIDGSPIFVVGCGHSGTSVLLAILGAHSRIHAVPYESGFATYNNQMIFSSWVKHFERLAVSEGKQRWAEKTPKHVLHLEKIFNKVPDAKVILILRDARDVVFSLKKRTGSLDVAINRWLSDNLAGEKFWNHPNLKLVKYEDLITDFEDSLRSILSFLGESYEPEIRDFHKVKRNWFSKSMSKPKEVSGAHHAQHRNWQINQPIFDGRGKWKKLSEGDLKIIDEKCGPLMCEMGYDRSL